MMELTKERLQQIVHAAGLEPCDYEEVFDGITTGEIVKMARQLLAGMEQEPVAYMVGDYSLLHYQDPKVDEYLGRATPLYAAPQLPQPAVDQRAVESLATDLMKRIDKITGERHSVATLSSLRVSIVEACRAAMLQGAEPVSQPDELPMDYQQGHKDGLEWAARLAEANHPQTGDWLYDDPLELAKAIRKGPDMPTAPVQGWIPCSERMPQEVGRYWCYVEEQNSLGKSHYQWNCSWNGDRWWVESENGGRVTHWMPLPAAPQQEAE